MRACEWADRIESAALRESFDDDERSHVRQCAECRTLTRIVRVLAKQGRVAERRGARHVPSAREVLRRARQIRTGKIQRRALRPIVWTERIAILIGFLALAAGVSWLARRTDELVGVLLRTGVEVPGPPDLTAVAIVVSGVVLLATTLSGLVGFRGR